MPCPDAAESKTPCPPVGKPEFREFSRLQAREAWNGALALWFVRIFVALSAVMMALCSFEQAQRAWERWELPWLILNAIGSLFYGWLVIFLLAIAFRGRLPR